MRYLLFFFLIFISTEGFRAQDTTNVIKVRKRQLLKKAAYDETDYKVIAIDVYGNPKTESIASFELHINIKGKLYKYFSPNNKLTAEMVAKLKELKKATKVWFTKIRGTESDGHLVELPDFDYMIFPKCKNCGK
jgi:hypothetical protein